MQELTNKNITTYCSLVGVAEPTDCHYWLGGLDKDGYGVFYAQGRSYKAHRVSAYLHGMNIDGLCVCHSCDNPKCVNPNHLFTGTVGDNNQDRHRKGRSRNRPTPGESHNMAQLTEESVRAIRASSNTGRRLASQYGISEAQISKIKNRKSWIHI
jgi:hypothetical protein